MTTFATKSQLSTPPRIEAKKPRIRTIVHDGVSYQMPSVTTVIDGAVANPKLGDWRVNTSCQDVVNQARGLYESLNGEKLTPDAFEYSLYKRIGQQWADYRIAEREAAGGSRVHDLIEHYLKSEMGFNDSPPPDHVSDATRCAFRAWQEWRSGVQLRPILLEKEVYSVEHMTSGRFDLYAEIDGRLMIGDWKTSKDIYPNHKIQLGGYYLLCLERGIQPIEGAMCVRLSKSEKYPFDKNKDVCIMEIEELQACADLFVQARKMYRFLNGN